MWGMSFKESLRRWWPPDGSEKTRAVDMSICRGIAETLQLMTSIRNKLEAADAAHDSNLRRQLGFARAGDVVFIECGSPISDDAYHRIAERLEVATAGTDVRCVILCGGLKVARLEPEKIDISDLQSGYKTMPPHNCAVDGHAWDVIGFCRACGIENPADNRG